MGVGGGIFLSPLLLFLRWAEVRVISGIAAAFILLKPGTYKGCVTQQTGWTNTQAGGNACYELFLDPKRMMVLRFGNTDKAETVAVQSAGLVGVEFHTDEYPDHDDEAYFFEGVFSDADLNSPAEAGRIFMPAVRR